MLKNIPRAITISLLLLFTMPLALQHISYLASSAFSQDSSDSSDIFRTKLRDFVERSSSVFTWLERVDYDLHLLRHNPGKPHADVAVIEVGEASLRELGQFPFSRTIYKHLLEKLELAGAKVVAFDITFPERDARNEVLVQLRQLRHEIEQKEGFDSPTVKEIDNRIFSLDADEDFATALHKANIPVVLGFTFTEEAVANLAVPKEVAEFFQIYDIFRRQYSGTGILYSNTEKAPVVSIPELMRSLNAKGSIGHFNPAPDTDSVIRRVPAVLEYNGRVLASLSTRALAAYYGEEPILDGSDGLSIRGVTRDAEGTPILGKMQFPVNPWGGFLVRFYGDKRVFPYTEFSDVVKGKLSEAELKEKFGGKVVFVGVTAIGLKDLRATPFSENYPGVEVHATVASNVLSQNFMLRDQRFFYFGYLFLWITGLFVSTMVFRSHPLQAFGSTAVSIAAIQMLGHYFFNLGVVVPTILPTLSCLGICFAGVFYRYFTEEREKKMVRASFSRYVSSAVVEEILKDQTKLRLGGQKKELTVMFVDLAGFTKISEHMDAAFVTTLLNEYFTRMTNIILRNHGTLDKYMGDGIMCFWGAPLELPDHARHACVTAIEMRQELARINTEWKAKHNITIENRIGVHTGEMAVGNMGSDQVFSYTVMGDNVNLGSRLEGVNTEYRTNIVVSAATVSKAGENFTFRPLDRVQVKGKEDAVDIFELVSLREQHEPEWVHAFRTGLRHYQAGEWDDAESAFGACLSLKPGDGPARIFIDRIHEFRRVAPPAWAGVWKFHSK